MADKKRKKYNNPLSATFTGIKDLFLKREPAGELKPTDRFDGRTVLVDGASSGLGFAVAVEVARRGAKVIMVCRSGIPGKGEKVKRLSRSDDIRMLQVDYSDLSSIRRLVTRIRDQFGKIDILICNAGLVPKKSRKTPQGLEEMFMVNYLSKFILVNLLLKENCFRHSDSGHPRIIFVSSETHRNPGEFDWDSFCVYKEYSINKSIELYGYYKLLLSTFAVELSRRLNADEFTCSVFALCPGPINTNIGREAPKIFHPLMKLIFALFFKSPARAAIPVVYLAASPDLENKPFDYLFLMSRKEPDEKALDPENGKRLWQLSDQLVNSLKE
ncbi:MAG: SDR family NAD(P)-dependent oxidoreductase [Bacteroidetes bacterium]|nr:MAG: SDR family NAD(P)-dependent oxidoreductase [Bacteroidota bacterium]